MPQQSIWTAPWAELERRTANYWGIPYGKSKGAQFGRKHRYFIGEGTGSVLGIGIGASAGWALGGVPGAAVGALAGSYLGSRTTGMQAFGFGALGAGVGTALGGPVGGFVGAGLGATFGLMGPGYLSKQAMKGLWTGTKAGGKAAGLIPSLWKSGPLGRAGIIGAGAGLAYGATQLMDADSYYSWQASSATAAAMVAPVVGVGMGIGIKGAMAGGGVKGFGNALWGKTGGVARSALSYMARKPVRAGGLLGLTMGMWSLGEGIVNMMRPNETIGSMAMGTTEARYGMDANNLDTQGLTLALHYRQL